MIFLILGAVAIFIWSKLSYKEPVSKTEKLQTEAETPPDITTKLKEGAAKVAAIVGGGGVAAKAASVVGGAVATGGVVAAAVPLTALPAATVLPAAVMEAAVGTGTGSSAIGAGAGGTSGAGAAVAGAAMVAAPLVIVPVIAKFLDKIFPKHVITEEEQAAMDAAHAFRVEIANLPGVSLVKGQFGVGD